VADALTARGATADSATATDKKPKKVLPKKR
jgi:hypothetical protein